MRIEVKRYPQDVRVAVARSVIVESRDGTCMLSAAYQTFTTSSNLSCSAGILGA